MLSTNNDPFPCEYQCPNINLQKENKELSLKKHIEK